MLNPLIRYQHLYEDMYQTGSTVICNPPVTNTDIDYVVLTKSLVKLDKALYDNGYETSYEDDEEYDLQDVGFACYRLGSINLIVTEQKEFYDKWVVATKLAKKMNLREKDQRITLFRYILYDEVNII